MTTITRHREGDRRWVEVATTENIDLVTLPKSQQVGAFVEVDPHGKPGDVYAMAVCPPGASAYATLAELDLVLTHGLGGA